MTRNFFSLASTLWVLTLFSPAALPEKVSVTLKPVYENLEFKRPVLITHPSKKDTRRFLVLQEGKILILPDDTNSSEATTYLDLSARDLIDNGFEEGLLGLAFHPDFENNRKFYIYHSQQNPKRSILSEWQQSAVDPNKADLTTERVLMEIPQPYWNHNSGNLLFGPDGMLYIGVGDGGKANDPLEHGQNVFALQGKILRIDVNTRAGDLAYGIPADNPFVGKPGHRHEIWAYGLRNPWGLSFDLKTGLLWCADVGQNSFEEINHITKGGNYGWVYREGFHERNPSKRPVPENAKFIEPIHEYQRKDGISITGGFVYRGQKLPALTDHYLYGDWGSGNLWALQYADGSVASNKPIFARKGPNSKIAFQPTWFYETADGEVLAVSMSTNLPGKQRGGIYELVAEE